MQHMRMDFRPFWQLTLHSGISFAFIPKPVMIGKTFLRVNARENQRDMQYRSHPPLPDELVQAAEQWWTAFCQAAENVSVLPSQDPDLIEALKRVWALSDFVARSCQRDPHLLNDLITSGDLERPYPAKEFTAKLTVLLQPVVDRIAGKAVAADADPLEELQRILRRFRKREMIRIAYRDILAIADLAETITALSAFADACIDQTLTLLYDWQCQVEGMPHGRDGAPQQLVVLGLGKLGARELNFSSDVDLIFAFPQAGQTDKADAPVSNDIFFTKLARRLIKVLGAVTADGYVFRVDLRLRPDGDNGPLVMSFDNMEEYYQSQGREWERYAWIKARVVAGDQTEGQRFVTMLQPFIYRRYLDYGVFKALRDMKQMIALEVKRKGMGNNIKLGPGGIREIEFFGQIFQLLRGGLIADLRAGPIRQILHVLAQNGYIETTVAEELEAAYVFLRQTEHRLQEFSDQQTHDLPKSALNRLRLAVGMGYQDWDSFEARLQEHRNKVQQSFSGLLASQEPEQQDDALQNQLVALVDIWHQPADNDQALETLAAAGFDTPQDVVQLIDNLQKSPATRSLSVEGRDRLDQLIPLVLQETASTANPDTILARIMRLIEAIEQRTCYIALLLENPPALKHLIRLVGTSPWIASFLARRPVLLDELLDARTLYVPPQRAQMEADVSQKLKRIAPDDLEFQIEELCILQQVNTLRVAAADITDVLPLMRVSDYLSDIAETVLNEVIELSWNHLVRKHGNPSSTLEGTPCERGFAVIAYGKLGGLELGYNSDLDLVFVHAADKGPTDGRKNPLDNAQFFARLGQRVIHILTTHTGAGRIYEIDMRLRPSGSAGMLVSHFNAFKEYQSQDAWTWEHQALLRARAISGDANLTHWFDQTRKAILTRPRDPETLCAEITDMRERMRAELLKPKTGYFDLKQDQGGIVDIEFLVQYLILLNAHQYPELIRWSDNVRQLQALSENKILDENTAYFLRHAYLVYRATTHRLNLQESTARVAEDRFQNLRHKVRTIWRHYLK